jgi:aryl-alcohol dehydrogenase-like predicted oxidoreductase
MDFMTNPKIFRRDFLKMIPYGLGLPLLAGCDRLIRRTPTPAAASKRPDPTHTATSNGFSDVDLPQLEKVAFGSDGLEVSRLAFGTGTHGVRGHSDQSALGEAGLADLLLQAYDHGVNFWDTADEYGTHPHVARALQSAPRDRVVILTKTMSRDGKRAAQDINRFLTELGTDVIDVVLLHAMTHQDWTDRYTDAMKALSRAKEQGKVRAVGVSCHSLAALGAAARTSWTDVVMARINYSGVEMDAAPGVVEPLLAEMHAAGKAVFGMKVLGAGRLDNDLRGAVEYVFNLGTVHAITIGMRNRAELAENIRLVGEAE